MPASSTPISYPARYAPGTAVNFADPQGMAVQVSHDSPLPVTISAAAGGGTTAPAALTGSTATTQQVGPFLAIAGKPLVLTLAGTWTGTVQLLRSVDGGVTRHPLTVGGTVWARFTANAANRCGRKRRPTPGSTSA